MAPKAPRNTDQHKKCVNPCLSVVLHHINNPMNKIVVIGLGNMLMGDEGIGIYLVQALQKKQPAFPGVDFIDLGVSGFKILHLMANREKVIFLDCAFMNEKPGVIRRFFPEEVETVYDMPALSNHHSDLLTLIKLSQKMGECPGKIVIFGIQPEIIAQQDFLSASLQRNWENYLILIEKEIGLTALNGESDA